MVWLGDQLWIANSPDLTVVRDLDGDDEADEYLRLYTDLGNIEHGLHGLNWAPDGKLYMSKGNSKGLNQAPDRIAPKAFENSGGCLRQRMFLTFLNPDFSLKLPTGIRFTTPMMTGA